MPPHSPRPQLGITSSRGPSPGLSSGVGDLDFLAESCRMVPVLAFVGELITIALVIGGIILHVMQNANKSGSPQSGGSGGSSGRSRGSSTSQASGRPNAGYGTDQSPASRSPADTRASLEDLAAERRRQLQEMSRRRAGGTGSRQGQAGTQTRSPSPSRQPTPQSGSPTRSGSGPGSRSPSSQPRQPAAQTGRSPAPRQAQPPTGQAQPSRSTSGGSAGQSGQTAHQRQQRQQRQMRQQREQRTHREHRKQREQRKTRGQASDFEHLLATKAESERVILQRLLHNPQARRQAFLVKELLGQPVSMRSHAEDLL